MAVDNTGDYLEQKVAQMIAVMQKLGELDSLVVRHHCYNTYLVTLNDKCLGRFDTSLGAFID